MEPIAAAEVRRRSPPGARREGWQLRDRHGVPELVAMSRESVTFRAGAGDAAGLVHLIVGLGGRGLSLRCSCRRFVTSRSACGHMWASLEAIGSGEVLDELAAAAGDDPARLWAVLTEEGAGAGAGRAGAEGAGGAGAAGAGPGPGRPPAAASGRRAGAGGRGVSGGARGSRVGTRRVDPELIERAVRGSLEGSDLLRSVLAQFAARNDPPVEPPPAAPARRGRGAQGRGRGLAAASPPELPPLVDDEGWGAPRRAPPPTWDELLRTFEQAFRRSTPCGRKVWDALGQRPERLLYGLSRGAGAWEPGLVVFRSRRTASGAWGKARTWSARPRDVAALADPLDRQILTQLHAEAAAFDPWFGRRGGCFYELQERSVAYLLPLLCRTGRLSLLDDDDQPVEAPLVWDDGPAWELGLEAAAAPGGGLTLRGFLARPGGERRPFTWSDVVFAAGFLVAEGRAARFDDRGAFAWCGYLRLAGGALTAGPEVAAEVVERLLELPASPLLDLPEPDEGPGTVSRPVPRLVTREGPLTPSGRRPRHLVAEVWFDYGTRAVAPDEPRPVLRAQADAPRVVRDLAFERAALARLGELGVSAGAGPDRVALKVAVPAFPGLVRTLLAEGWRVEAEGVRYRPAAAPPSLRVTTGEDWFELRGTASFDGEEVPLPRVLQAVRAGRTTVRLGDGSEGVLPERWLARVGLLDALGTVEGDAVRVLPSQAWLLDALLAERVTLEVDRGWRRQLARLGELTAGTAAVPEPEGFAGELRPYQREALGWLLALGEAGLGGCLADDMGLGKTVQVLALLCARRAAAGGPGSPGAGGAGARAEVAGADEGPRPSLVVAPRSVLFNWRAEAAQFAPGLRVHVHWGAGREAAWEEARGRVDLVLTTYGTLRRDAEWLAEEAFDVAVLDEAQAIKNDRSQAAKAARLVRARQRLALSGTPIENHLGELWSLFQFLNPGLLGRRSGFARLFAPGPAGAGGAGPGGPGEDGDGGAEAERRRALARALSPFVLRRTKEEVLRELPEKTEQVLTCALGPEQRALYERIRRHMQETLLAGGAAAALEGDRLNVLAGLLRLRQAACHPGLLGEAGRSAKAEVLLERLREVVEQGHKALVFSQFTTLLGLVRGDLEAAGIGYAYLDGQTRDRQAAVARFQEDPECRVFLISLKAGGTGLNLTAAEYVFLLDPWWNPAVEAQAIDRAHRIGQTRPVFAYRLVAEDSVEEKILELQARKRALADAVLAGQGSVVSELSAEDLDLLLS